MTSTRALVWFKRDLRIRDHRPLAQAREHGDALAVFVFEPEWLSSPEFDPAHAEFTLGCLAELRGSLARWGLPLLVLRAPMIEVLETLHRQYSFTHLLSHQETGPAWSWTRDRAVARWCEVKGVCWEESSQTGVVRGLTDRNGWAARWQSLMDAPACRSEGEYRGVPIGGVSVSSLPTLSDLGLRPSGRRLQAPGEAAATQLLNGFLSGRGRDYRQALSSPLSAESGCSRLSPHLAFGTLSMRTVHQATEQQIAQTSDRSLAWGLRGFAGRLRWHCHFMQKLEDEPAIELQNFARHCDGLRESSFDEERFAAWCEGRTGFPMVDACMRSLKATGWLNFRMRAMLVSFASYHLWLHWRPTGLFLARQFLDFETGIHWSQMQMQSGTTGINTLRIYSPTKQARDHDPQGRFIRRWVPELREVPIAWLAQPWLMDAATQSASGCRIGIDYPSPLVDETQALRAARDRLHALRQTDTARDEADRIQVRHGSRRSGLPPTTRAARGPRTPVVDDRQARLFD
jgi:deoxyribodipyrimidine photo-lyase